MRDVAGAAQPRCPGGLCVCVVLPSRLLASCASCCSCCCCGLSPPWSFPAAECVCVAVHVETLVLAVLCVRGYVGRLQAKQARGVCVGPTFLVRVITSPTVRPAVSSYTCGAQVQHDRTCMLSRWPCPLVTDSYMQADRQPPAGGAAVGLGAHVGTTARVDARHCTQPWSAPGQPAGCAAGCGVCCLPGWLRCRPPGE